MVFIVVRDGAKEYLTGPEGYHVAEFSEPHPKSMGYLRSAYNESDQAFESALSMASQGVHRGVDPATARGRLFAELID